VHYLSPCSCESSSCAGSVFFEKKFDGAKWKSGPFASFVTELSKTRMKRASVVGFSVKAGGSFAKADKKKKVSATIVLRWCYGNQPLVS
jgi:hypothetical protein